MPLPIQNQLKELTCAACSYGLKHKYDHLVCFVPGMLALGAHSGAVTGAKAER